MKRIFFLLLIISASVVVNAQMGENSLSAGPLASLPIGADGRKSNLHFGFGLEVLGQYNFAQISAVILKSTLTSWAYKKGLPGYFETKRITYFTIQGGYRYTFGGSVFFINGLIGQDIELQNGSTSFSFTIGVGKRVVLNENRFFEVGLDFVGADGENRLNIKMLISLF